MRSQGTGETISLSTSLSVGGGQHQIKLRVYSHTGSFYVNQAAQLVVIEG